MALHNMLLWNAVEIRRKTSAAFEDLRCLEYINIGFIEREELAPPSGFGFGIEQMMQTGTLKLETEVKDGVLMVQVSGPLDSATYDYFKEFMEPILAQPHVRIVMDCRKLTYVNSRAWTLLMHYHRVALQALSDFKIAAFDPHSLKGIQRMGLDKSLAWLPTVEQALHPAFAM